MRQRVGKLSAPVRGEPHAIVDIRQGCPITLSFCIVARSPPELQSGIVLAESLASARERLQNLISGRVREGAIANELLQRRGEIIRRLAVGVFLPRRATGGVQVP